MVFRAAGPEPWEDFADAVLGQAGEGDEAALEQAQDALWASLGEPSLFTATSITADLAPADVATFALLLAVELDEGRQRRVAVLLDDPNARRVTLGLLARLRPDGHLPVAASAPLHRAALVRVDTDGPWAARSVAVPGPVAWNFAGDRGFDPDLPDRHRLISAGVPPVGARELLLLSGADRETRIQIALQRFGGAVLVTPVPETVPQWDAVVRMSTLGMMGVVLELPADPLPALAVRYLERATHLSWALSSEVEQPLESLPNRSWVELKVDAGIAPPAELEATLGRPAPGGTRLTREQLRLVAAASPGLDGDVAAGIRRLAGGHLDRLALRIRPRRTWDDLVLPAPQLERVRELATRYRYRDTVYRTWGFVPLPSTGVVALFSGPSGTGKTLAAEVIAGDLGLDLFKLDLSSVVSKYIGETEKNLESVFSAAETGDAVLFLDEADALLGKRSEVSDAHDRYANLEVAYLLQRLERHDGMVLLATNLARNIDDAFLRRIHVAVEFPVPKEPERLALWERSFPPDCPTAGLDFAWLARQFELTGGIIRNVSVAAAFLAARHGGGVTMDIVFDALRSELQKMGRLVAEDGFSGWDDMDRLPQL
jgi:hypothetical protein